MKSSKGFFTVVTVVVLEAAAAQAAHVDMNDPRRALGREDDVRVDAQMTQDSVGVGSPISVTYQIHNLTSAPIAVADKVTDVSYDEETATITMSIGSEVPAGGAMPHLVTVAPGEKKTLAASASFNVPVVMRAGFRGAPRYVVVKVNVLRNVEPFTPLIAQQGKTVAPLRLSDAQFDAWMEANDAIFLNAIPVRWDPKRRNAADVESRGSTAMQGMF